MKTKESFIGFIAAFVVVACIAGLSQIAFSQSSSKSTSITDSRSSGSFSDSRKEFTIYIGYDPEQVQLNAARGVRYIWTPSEGLNNPTIPNPIARPHQTTIYTVAITDGNGYIHLQRFLVNVIDVRCGRGDGFVEMCYSPPGTHGLRGVCVERSKVRELLLQGYQLGDCDLTGGNNGGSGSISENVIINAYPDPFSEDTRIDLTLAENTNLTMEVTDLYGCPVGNIFKGTLDAGQHTFDWGNNLTTIAPAVYFLRVVSNTDSKTIKLITE
jgi:hypothetical protein